MALQIHQQKTRSFQESAREEQRGGAMEDMLCLKRWVFSLDRKILNSLEDLTVEGKMEYSCHCIVHGKKYCSDFQYVMNFLRAKSSEKSDNFAYVSPIVCCCKHKDALATEGKIQDCESKRKREEIGNLFKESELKNAMESVLMMEGIPTKVTNVLNKWNNRSQDSDGLVLYGNSRVAGLVLLCLKGNRTLLRNPVSTAGQSTRHQLTLPIYTSMLGVYFGRNGRNVRSLCRKNKFVICAEERALPGSQASLKNAEITVVCRKERFEMVQKLLVAKANELLEKRRADHNAKSLAGGLTS